MSNLQRLVSWPALILLATFLAATALATVPESGDFASYVRYARFIDSCRSFECSIGASDAVQPGLVRDRYFGAILYILPMKAEVKIAFLAFLSYIFLLAALNAEQASTKPKGIIDYILLLLVITATVPPGIVLNLLRQTLAISAIAATLQNGRLSLLASLIVGAGIHIQATLITITSYFRVLLPLSILVGFSLQDISRYASQQENYSPIHVIMLLALLAVNISVRDKDFLTKSAIGSLLAAGAFLLLGLSFPFVRTITIAQVLSLRNVYFRIMCLTWDGPRQSFSRSGSLILLFIAIAWVRISAD